jgi:hypothetical protein
MGVDYTAIAVLGVNVTGKLHTHELVTRPVCSHTVVPNAKFCSECGAKATYHAWVPVKGYDEDLPKIGSFQVINGTYDDRYPNLTPRFVGVAVEVGNYDNPRRLPIEIGQFCGDIEALQKNLQATLEPLGLWDPKMFGIWAVLQCPY